MNRQETLERAAECVCKSREDDYGAPEDNFKTIARLWTAFKGVEFSPTEVAIMMALLKIARLKGGNFKEDSFVDLAGYAACAAELATKKKSGRFSWGAKPNSGNIGFKDTDTNTSKEEE